MNKKEVKQLVRAYNKIWHAYYVDEALQQVDDIQQLIKLMIKIFAKNAGSTIIDNSDELLIEED